MSPTSKKSAGVKNELMDHNSSDLEKQGDRTSSKSKSSSSKQFGRVNRLVLDKNSEEYKKRRERNNMAVKKSRNKSKQKTQQTMQRVVELKAENERLETKVKILSKELSFLKDLFLAHASAHNGQIDLNLSNGRSHLEGINDSGPINSNVISSTFVNKLSSSNSNSKKQPDD